MTGLCILLLSVSNYAQGAVAQYDGSRSKATKNSFVLNDGQRSSECECVE